MDSLSARGSKIDNPYSPPRTDSRPPPPLRELTDRDVQTLKRSLIWFGVTGFVAPILFAFVTDDLTIDIFALFVGVTGASITRRSFSTFPWTLLILALYPVIFVAGLFSPEVTTIRFWLIPTRLAHPPLLYYLILACWAVGNSVLILRQYNSNRTSRLIT